MSQDKEVNSMNGLRIRPRDIQVAIKHYKHNTIEDIIMHASKVVGYTPEYRKPNELVSLSKQSLEDRLKYYESENVPCE